MQYHQFIKHFGTATAAARILGISVQAISKWKRHGIPLGRQYEIQVLTGGTLRAGGPNRPRRAVKNNNQSVRKFSSSLIDNGANA